MMSNEIAGELSESETKTYVWKIPNFSSFSSEPYPHKFLNSQSFIFENKSWHFSFRPYDDLSLFLVNETRFPCHVTYSFSLKSSKGKYIATQTASSTIKKKAGFISYFDKGILDDEDLHLLPLDTLTIVCNLTPARSGKPILASAQNENCLKKKSKAEKKMELTETDLLSSNLKEILDNKSVCDAVLCVQGTEFAVHKTILVARSTVFAAMFQHDSSEKQTGIINIPDCDLVSFPEFLEYLYSGKLKCTSLDSALHLYMTSDKYNVQELKAFCKKYMMQNFTIQLICDVIVLADKYDETELFSAAQKYFNGHLKNILKSSEWEGLLKMNYRLANKLLIEMSESKK